MTSEVDFTEAEWDRLTQLPVLAAIGAVAAEHDGPVTSTRELWAGMRALARGARQSYARNELIQAAMRVIAEQEDGADLAIGGWRARGTLDEAVAARALETAAEVRQILTERATSEAADYVAWIMGIARASAEGARSGLWGLSGARVTAREARFLDNLGAALGAYV